MPVIFLTNKCQEEKPKVHRRTRVSMESVYFFSLQISELHNTDSSVLPIMQLFNAFVAFMTCVS